MNIQGKLKHENYCCACRLFPFAGMLPLRDGTDILYVYCGMALLQFTVRAKRLPFILGQDVVRVPLPAGLPERVRVRLQGRFKKDGSCLPQQEQGHLVAVEILGELSKKCGDTNDAGAATDLHASFLLLHKYTILSVVVSLHTI